MAEKATFKDEAITTIERVIARLRGPQDLDKTERKQLAMALEHAKGCVTEIEELKRARPVKKNGTETPPAPAAAGGTQAP